MPAQSPVITNTNFNGDVLDYIIQEAVVGNEVVQKGSVYVIPDVSSKISIGKMVASANPVKAREAMPSTKTGTVTWSEDTLNPVDLMIYIPDINPRLFESNWRPFQPKGALPNRILNPQIQKVFADVVNRQAQLQIGTLMWKGDTTLAESTGLNFFNGYITRGIASGANVDVSNIGAITASNIIAVLEDCEAAVPAPLFEDPDMIIHMSTATYRMYEEAQRALTYKGKGPADKGDPNFAGREIRFYSGFPANTILICKATSGLDSNLYAATDKITDSENFIIEKLRPEGEHYFLKALFKLDVNYSIISESVLYVGS